MSGRGSLPLGLLIALQVFDVAIHVATDQFEPLRVASNVAISAGAIASTFLAPGRANIVLIASAGAYLALNLVFLAQYGLINPTSGAPRIPLFGFVLGSLALAYWVARRRSP